MVPGQGRGWGGKEGGGTKARKVYQDKEWGGGTRARKVYQGKEGVPGQGRGWWYQGKEGGWWVLR